MLALSGLGDRLGPIGARKGNEETVAVLRRISEAAKLVRDVASSDPYSVSEPFIAGLWQHSPVTHHLVETLSALLRADWDDTSQRLGPGPVDTSGDFGPNQERTDVRGGRR